MDNLYRMSAFTKDSVGGNPAGVVLNADNFREEQMKHIAKEIGYSETAFVLSSDKADFKVRFFTPVNEVDLCGHATIATFNLLRDLSIIECGNYTQETKAGILKLNVLEDYVYMEQNKPSFYEIISKDEIKQCFNGSGDNYIDNMPIQIVSTGIRDIMLPIKNIDELMQLEPNLEVISKVSKRYNATGIHAFCLETYEDNSAHCRNFAPLYGIDEESATGTSNGALACYLSRYLYESSGNDFVFEQGYSLNRPSEIKVKTKQMNNQIEEVLVGGRAARMN